MDTYCHRCGNHLPGGSQFCNKCGAKIKDAPEGVRRPNVKAPPPRPARRHPILESRPTARPVEEEEDQYEEQVIDRPTATDRRINNHVVARENQENGVIFRINQAFYPALVAYFGSTVASLAVAALITWLHINFLLIPAFAVLAFIPAIIRHIKLRLTIFTLTPTKLEIESGFFFKKSRNIPLRHIQDVFVSESFKERIIGIGDIIIDTAATEGRISLDNISEPRMYADLILDQLHSWD